MKVLDSFKAAYLLFSNVRSFHPEEVFNGKRVAVVGAADTAFDEKNGDFIDSFDLVVRVNKALHIWKPEDQDFIGKKADVLYHSFFENEYSGGGPINFEVLKEFGVQYLVHPHRNFAGLVAHFNFYKRHQKKEKTYLLDEKNHQLLMEHLKDWVPTIGFSALLSVMNSSCKEVYITGFTFFKTAYAPGYRDHFLDSEVNNEHIKEQGLHNPELEYQVFLKNLKSSNCTKIHFDKALASIIANDKT